MVRPLELELRTFDRQRARLEEEHLGKFVLIRGAEIAGIFEDFQSASEYAARWLQRQSYLIHAVGAEGMRIPPALLDGLAAIYGDTRASRHRAIVPPGIGHRACPTRTGMVGH